MAAVIKTLTVTLGSESGLKLAKGIAVKPQSCDAVEVTALDDTVKKYIAAAVSDSDEFTISVYGAVSTAIGAKVAVSFAGTTSDSSGTISLTIGNCLVTKLDGEEVSADGDRKYITNITLKPDGTTGT